VYVESSTWERTHPWGRLVLMVCGHIYSLQDNFILNGTNYPSFHLLYMVSGGLEPICHRNSSTFESNNKSETKSKTAAPNELWHDIGYVKC